MNFNYSELAFPNFLVIGAQKAGTTSLFHSLNNHPEIFMCHPKEPAFFMLDGRPIPLDYPFRNYKVQGQATFTLTQYQNLFERGKEFKLRGEATTLYLNSIYAADRIKTYRPTMKLIVVLRNPVDRAYSLYWFRKLHNREQRSFEEVVNWELKYAPGPNFDELVWWKEDAYMIKRGYYFYWLNEYYLRFSGEYIKVILFEDLIANPQLVFTDIYRFLGASSEFVPKIEQHNRAGKATFVGKQFFNMSMLNKVGRMLPERTRATLKIAKNRLFLQSYPPMKLDTRKKLIQNYFSDIMKLESLIDRDLKSWYTK